MTGERTEKALARMDSAVRRIAAASVRAKAAMDARGERLEAQSAQLATQTRRNEALREAVTEALRELDLAINSAGAGAPGDMVRDAAEAAGTAGTDAA